MPYVMKNGKKVWVDPASGNSVNLPVSVGQDTTYGIDKGAIHQYTPQDTTMLLPDIKVNTNQPVAQVPVQANPDTVQQGVVDANALRNDPSLITLYNQQQGIQGRQSPPPIVNAPGPPPISGRDLIGGAPGQGDPGVRAVAEREGLTGAFPQDLNYNPAVPNTQPNVVNNPGIPNALVGGNVQPNVGNQVVTTPGNQDYLANTPDAARYPLPEGVIGPVVEPTLTDPRGDSPTAQLGGGGAPPAPVVPTNNELDVSGRADFLPSIRPPQTPAPVEVGDKPQPSIEEFSLLGKEGLNVGKAFGALSDWGDSLTPEQGDRLAEAFFTAAVGSSAPGSIPSAIGKGGLNLLENKRKAEERDYQRAIEGRKETREEKRMTLQERMQGFHEYSSMLKQVTDEEQFGTLHKWQQEKFYKEIENQWDFAKFNHTLQKDLLSVKAEAEKFAKGLNIDTGMTNALTNQVMSSSTDVIENVLANLDTQSEAGDVSAASQAKQLREMMATYADSKDYATAMKINGLINQFGTEEDKLEMADRMTDTFGAYAMSRDPSYANRVRLANQGKRGWVGIPSEGAPADPSAKPKGTATPTPGAVTVPDKLDYDAIVTEVGSNNRREIIEYLMQKYSIEREEAFQIAKKNWEDFGA